MSRFDDSGDEPWVEHGDRFFNSYNEKLEATLLPEGTVAKSINKRFRDGVARPRKGSVIQGGNASQWNPAINPTIQGSGYFNDPTTGTEYIAIAIQNVSIPALPVTEFYLYNIAADSWQALPPFQVFNATGGVWISQAFDKLIFLPTWATAGTGAHQWTNIIVWDGTTLEWAQWNGVPTNDVIPPSRWGVPVSNRMVYWGTWFGGTANHYTQSGYKGDHLVISNIEDYANADFVNADFRINTGEADHIHTIIPYSYDTIIIFMHKSIHLLANFSAAQIAGQTPFSSATQELLTAYVGCGSIRSPIQVGQEVYFMSEGVGVMRLSEVLEKRLMARTLPVSDDIQPVIDRINWMYQDTIVSAAQDNYVFFAVPLDTSEVANAILVYNTTTSKWESVDELNIQWQDSLGHVNQFHIDNIVAAHVADTRRLFAIQNTPPMIFRLYEGTMDQVPGPIGSNGANIVDPQIWNPVADELETRDYGFVDQAGPNSYRRFERGTASFEPSAGTLTLITAMMDNGSMRVLGQDVNQPRLRAPIKRIDRSMSLNIQSPSGCNIIATSVESREIHRNAMVVGQPTARGILWFEGDVDPTTIPGGIPPAEINDLYLNEITGDVWVLQ